MRRATIPERLRAALAEPLVQFALVALVLFAVDRVRARTAGGRADVPAAVRLSGVDGAVERHLVVEPETLARLAEGFERAEGRAPSAGERRAALDRWIEDEILFREAVARKLDRGDDRVRQILASKMRTVLEREALAPEPTDVEVRAAFDANPSRWAKEAAVDFVHVFVHGDDAAAEARARGLLAELEKGAEPGRMGDLFNGGRRYRRRAITELTEIFGEAFTKGLAEQPVGAWRLRRSRFGTHLVRLEGTSAAEPPAFDDVREALRLELVEARRAAALEARAKELRARWTVVEPAP